MGEGPNHHTITVVHRAVVGRVPHMTIAREQGECRGKRVACPPYPTAPTYASKNVM